MKKHNNNKSTYFLSIQLVTAVKDSISVTFQKMQLDAAMALTAMLADVLPAEEA
jgi:hypothetical protein